MDTIMDPYFEDCLQGLAHAEKVFRRCCEKEIVRIQNDLKKSLWESLSCISRTDVKNLCINGWQYTVTEHDCPGNTACNMFLKLCLKKLPWASKLNRDRFLRAMYLSSSWEFAKLFLEPWMHRLHGFEELDSFCLLLLLDNISSIRQDTPSDSERHKKWVDLYHAQLGKGSNLAEACFREDTQHLTEAERDNFLQAIINILECLLDEDLDEAIGFIVKIRGTLNRDLALIDRTLDKRTRLQEMRQEFQKMMKDFVSTIPKEDAQPEEKKTLDRDLETHSCFSKEPFVPGIKLGKGIIDRKQFYPNLEDSTLIRHILQMGDPVDLVYLFYKKRNETESEYPHKGGEITKEKYLCIQGLIHLLEKNLATDITDIVCSLLGALKLSEFNLGVMPYSHYSKLQDVVKKMESTKPLKTLLKIEWIIGERNFSNWCKCVYALKYLQTALVPLVQEKMTNLYKDVINDFRRNICADATSEDLRLKPKVGIRFHHKCHKNEPPCDFLIDRIEKNFCLKSVSDIFNILKFTDPQNWLRSPFDFASLFLQTWMVQGNVDFSQCDISALCKLVKNCKPVREMFKEMHIKNVKSLRDRTMDCAEFSISHIEMKERIYNILDMLRTMFKSHKTDAVAEAIELVGQLLTSDFKFSRDEGMRVYKKTVASVKRRMHYKRDITCQCIKQMESDVGFISSGRNTNVSYCREHRHGQKRDIKEEWPLDRVFVSDEADHTPTVTTTEMEWRQDSLPVKKHSDNISEATMDEDSGQGASSGAIKPHDQGDENKCAKCGETGTVVSAAGFCRACSLYLCTNCLEHHKKSSATQDHELMENAPMPLEDIAPFNVERCKAHTSKPIEAYCVDDDTFVCSICLSTSHRSCHNKGSLYDLSRGVESSQEFLDIKDAAERYKMLQKEYNDDIKLNLSRNYEWHTQTLEGFQKFRSIVNDKKEVETDASRIIQENTRKRKDLAESTAKISEELKEYMATINKASHQNENQRFIALKKHGRRVHECLERLDTLHKEVLITKFGFKFDPRTRKSLLKKRKVNISRPTRTQLEEEVYSRMFTQSSPKVLYTLATFLNIKSPEDSIECNIMDIMELSPNELVLTDANNKCLKKLSIDSNKIIARLALDRQPKGIAQFRESVAVSFPQAKQIRFYRADLTPDVRRAIDVSAECHGLHWSNNLLIVSCINPAQVHIITVASQPLHIIENNPEGTLFQKPLYSILKHDARLIYVSDFAKNTLTCMNRVGIVQWVYRNEQLKGPEGMITMDYGCIYLCSRETNTIHVVSPNGVKLAVIPISNFGINHPCAAFYSNRNRTLYVCSESGNSENGNFIGVVNRSLLQYYME